MRTDESSPREAPALGIDLGGTNIHTGVVSTEGEIAGESVVPTQATEDAETVFGNIVRSAELACEQAGLKPDDVAAVGIGSPGSLDMETGLIVSPGNLPGLRRFPVVARLEEALAKPVVLNNDANCFGLAEARFGAGAGAGVCCALTLGTGLGAAVVLEGRLYNGPRGAAAEIWCSPHGGEIVEEAVSGRGVSRNYARLTGEQRKPEAIAEMARDGHKEAREAWQQFGRDLAAPVSYVCNLLDPDVVVLGGSLSKAFDLFQRTLEETAEHFVNDVNWGRVRLVRAALRERAGVLGAAALTFTEL